MTPRELLTLFRIDTRDQAEPTLWSDLEIYLYMNDAQKMFCRLTGGISDYVSPLTRVAFAAGDESVPYDERILKLRSVTRQDGRVVRIENFEGGEAGVCRAFSNVPSQVEVVVTGMTAGRLHFPQPASDAGELRLLVYRLPLENVDGYSGRFEIDQQHHEHLLAWMKHRAYSKQDAETYDKGKADEFYQEFLAYCDRAKAERERREHKYRTIAYGGL